MLELRAVRKNYGNAPVLRGVDLRVADGECVGVIGPNGAGKTTLFQVVSGAVSCDAGSVFLGGRDITALPPDARCRAGIGRTFQVPQPFGGMTVYENVLVAATFGGGLRDAGASRHAACAALDACGLRRVADQAAGSLTLLQRKRLELARAMATSPRLLLLDEVGGGLTDGEVAELLALLRDLRGRGITIVWIEHIVHALASVVDRLVVLAEGTVLAEGPMDAVMADARVRETYLGDALSMQNRLAA